MRFSTTAFIASLAATSAIAMPTDVLTKRDTPPAQCSSKHGSVSNFWGIYYPHRGGNVGDWANGILDNVRGRGCLVTNWQAIQDNEDGVACTFSVPLTCQAYDIAAALNAASGEWIYCEGDTMNGLFDGAGQVISGFAGVLGDVAGALGIFAK
ncbi:hypothetical protein AUEXF2481DRAFT_44886 [Aureobasidium subglaciale EXF-2481]|uniref:Ecp2 effector protein domain-containing protein n=1 Tax=Aureobasidium subglaciale (strain EXF-2481) TaxID=1043005 RepID=A0A074Y429_AURSE|nr:uncharacterized protein AUEXF2481DRAFT_44886 [Aureobasidium subglaciale EXF-2481]KAI5201534.1 hypothetical protein E4T38_06060 [Aureobasidium subglaciale]KAI5220096.1 hypothetical protein E4T40_06081 [Aureobasidium subglaciale]KAI5223996.1 hypothetical protein E4T41_05921 [Aureobasidium subglaciale]KAI5260681.1 hypothetical protein E4T46_05815 [Aureobasidium subglaciale]KEQ90689.1 hypothetical protein AUEXF2481DRAFT_44886 [Aureobasidium subglaciale EXF-2481]